MKKSEINYEHFPLTFISRFEEDTDIWFVTENWNAVFKMNKESYEAQYCGFFEKYIGRAESGYREIFRWNGKMLVVPVKTDFDLCIIKDEKKKYISFPQAEIGYVIHRTMTFGRYAFIFTTNEKNAVLRFDMEEETIDTWIDLRQYNIYGKIEKWLLGGVWQEKDWIYCIVRNENLLVKVSVCERKLEYFTIEEKLSSECYKTANSVWAVTEDRKRIIQMNDDKVTDIIDFAEYVPDYSFWGFVLNDGMLWLFPDKTEDIIKIDLQNKERTVLKYPSTFGWINDARYQRGCRFYCYDEDEKKIVLYPRCGNGVLVIDKNTDEMQHIPLVVNMRAIIDEQINQVGADNIFTWENDLKGYINLIVEKQSFSKVEQTHSVGEYIFRACY